MMCYYEGAAANYVSTLDNINLVFTIVFTIEATLKLIGFGKTYFYVGCLKFLCHQLALVQRLHF